jgi:GTP-binding protein
MDAVYEVVVETSGEPEADLPPRGIKLAIVGRPNVGKSTLVNRILGEERVIVYDQPGTTRDSIYIPFERAGQSYTIIDTAGVRRRKNIDEAVEKFSVVKTLQAIEDAHVVIYMIDGQDALTDQDLSLLGFILDAGRSLVVAVNKWDHLSEEQRVKIKTAIDRQLEFVSFAKLYFISALHGSGVGVLLDAVNEAYACATMKLSASKLTRILQKAVFAHQPPSVHGRRIKLRYAHAGGHLPPIIVIHGNQTADVPITYQRYLENYFRAALKMVGTPVRFVFQQGENPYEGRKNILTPRQLKKRARLKRFTKK